MANSIPVSWLRTRPSPDNIARGQPVVAMTQWSEMAYGCNWVIGKGACLVPYYNPASEIPSGSTYTYRFRVRPRGFAIQRNWGVYVQAVDHEIAARITIRAPAGSGTAYTVDAPAGYVAGSSRRVDVPALSYSEPLSGRSSTEQEISISIQAVDGDVAVYGIECYEADRPAINDDATDLGVLTETARAGTPIIHRANQSNRGVCDALAGFDARRVGIFHWAVDPTAEKFSRMSATPASISGAIYWLVQGPKLNIGATLATVKWSAYARMATSGGSGGSVKLTTSASGVSDSATVTGTSFAWTAARSVDIVCDDFSAVDGFAEDKLFVLPAGDGTRTVEVASVSMWVDSVT